MTPTVTQTGTLSTRERILLEASRLFARNGYRGTSTREIAAAVGIRQPSLFHHFPSKQTIMAELIDIDHAEATRVAKREAAASGSPAVRLYRYLVADISFICRCAYDLSSVESVLNDSDFGDKRQRHNELQGARLAIIEEGIDSGEFVKSDPLIAHKVITWILRGDIVDTAGEPQADADDFAHQLASFVLRAVLADPDRVDEIRAGVELEMNQG
ncbi:MAG: TetR/AcrR family transcriptional regulator [Acidimicrobiia bacterium]|nr:TetR/AcrR family transcriptional regulator [Acidimicrobiia bacterium]